jgi:hypothetical protein
MAHEFDSVVNNSKKFEIDLYKQLLEPSNPYVAYNNVDRFLNVSYRFYTTGKLESWYKRTRNEGYKDQINSDYEKRTNVMSQYYWGSTAWLGAAYALNRPALFSSSSEDRSIAAGVLSRALINLVLESALLAANGFRYSRSLTATGPGDRAFDLRAPNMVVFVPAQAEMMIDHNNRLEMVPGFVQPQVVAATPTSSYTDTLLSVENVIGTALADSLTGDANSNELSGKAGNDTLVGGAGDDRLNGGVGADSVSGGAGDDIIEQIVEDAGDTLDGGDGTDTANYSS